MPGNEVADKLHNFFEQDNAPQSHQSHTEDGLWPILNNITRVGNLRQNVMPLNSNSNISSAQYLDSERENVWQSSQTTSGTNINQFALNPGFDKRQLRNQQLGLNRFEHGLEGLQTKYKQAEFLEHGVVSDRRSSMFGGLAAFESNAPQYGSGYIINSERTEVAKVPDNVDFLGNQQQLTRSQNLGMSPHPRQHPEFIDMQLWQQHLLFKQLQELQRQQQPQQLDRGARQQNSHSQLSSASEHAGVDQSPATLNGVPINASNYMIPDNFVGELKTPINSQMSIVGNKNWAQLSGSPVMHGYSSGLMFPNDQRQATPQLESSLRGTPVSSTTDSSIRYSHFPGMSPDCTDVMTMAGANKGYRGKSLFGNASVQNHSSDAVSGNLQQVNHLQQNVHPQDFQGRQEQADWSCKLQENAAAQVGPFYGTTSLDPTEEKLLFGSADDDTWDASFGSWSALVEDAVRGSSDGKGLKEEWNCSNFQKPKSSTANHSAVLNDNEKLQSMGLNTNLQSASLLTSKSLPFFNDADSNSNHHAAPAFQHSCTKFAYEQSDREATTASHESFQQSFVEAKTRQFDLSQRPKQFVDGRFQAQVPRNVNNGVLAGNTYEPSMNIVHSSDMDFNSQNVQEVWAHQQNVPLSDARSHPNIKPHGWNVNERLQLGGDNTLKYQDNGNIKQYPLRDGTNRTMPVESTYDGNTCNIGVNNLNLSGLEPESDNGSQHKQTEDACIGNFTTIRDLNTAEMRLEMNREGVNMHQVDFGKHVPDSFFISQGESVGKYGHRSIMRPQTWDSSLNINGKGSGETSYKKQEHPTVSTNEDYTSNHSHRGQHTDNRDVEQDNSFLTGSEPHPSISVNKKPSGQTGRQAAMPHRFQYQPMGNLGMNAEVANSPSHTSRFQSPPQSFIGGFQNQDQGYIGVGQFTGCGVSNNVIGMAKGKCPDFRTSITEAEEIQPNSANPSHNSTASASFGGSTVKFPRNSRIVQTSQNMLELLHKVDQSREHTNVSHSSLSDNNMASEISETAASHGSASRLQSQHRQSSLLHGFGLRLAPPSQIRPVSNHVLPSQASLNGYNSKQGDPKAGDKDQTRLTSTASIHSWPAAHETPQRESLNNKSSSQTCKDTSHLSAQTSSLQQQPQQHISAPGGEVMDQPQNLSSGSLAEVDAHVKHACLHGQSHDSHDQAVNDKSFQPPLPSVSGRKPPFRLPYSADNLAPASKFYSANAGHSQPADARFYHLKNSVQQLPVVETRSVSQSPTTSGMPRQAGFTTMLHNVSAQQHLSSVQPHKFTPNTSPSILRSTSGRGTSSQTLQKADDGTSRGGSASSECGAGSSPQRVIDEEHSVQNDSSLQTLAERANITPEKGGTSQRHASVSKHLTDGNSSVSISSLVHLHQQESKEKGGRDSLPNSQIEDVPLPNVVSSSSGIVSYGSIPKQSDTPLLNYSLLQQMEAMKSSDSDSVNRVGKRLKGADLGSDTSHDNAGQRFIYGQNSVFRIHEDGEHAANSRSSFPRDVKMLSFSLRESDDTSASTTSQLVGISHTHSQDVYTSREHHPENHTHSLSLGSTSNFTEGSQIPRISPQIAPSWFELYGTYKKGQVLETFAGQRTAKAAAQQFFFPKVSESKDNNILVEQRTDTDLGGSLGLNKSSTIMTADASSSPHLLSDITDQDMVLRPKKRKSATSELLPLYKQVTENSRRLQNISTAELDWGQATNRLIEKVEDESEMIDDSLSMPQFRRRLILTIQLMQQLLPSLPSAVLAAQASLAYEIVTYSVAKEALRDARRLITYSRSDSRLHLDSGNKISEKMKNSEVGDHILLKIAEDLMGRSRNLEIDLSRLEKRRSLLDLRMECQELERFSIINRFGKFHGPGHTDGVVVESSSTSKTTPRRTFPERYVTALSMPGNLPERVPCLSL